MPTLPITALRSGERNNYRTYDTNSCGESETRMENGTVWEMEHSNLTMQNRRLDIVL